MTFTREVRLMGTATRAARSRRRAAIAIEMDARGLPPKAIARHLGVHVETVRAYLRAQKGQS